MMRDMITATYILGYTQNNMEAGVKALRRIMKLKEDDIISTSLVPEGNGRCNGIQYH